MDAFANDLTSLAALLHDYARAFQSVGGADAVETVAIDLPTPAACVSDRALLGRDAVVGPGAVLVIHQQGPQDFGRYFSEADPAIHAELAGMRTTGHQYTCVQALLTNERRTLVLKGILTTQREQTARVMAHEIAASAIDAFDTIADGAQATTRGKRDRCNSYIEGTHLKIPHNLFFAPLPELACYFQHADYAERRRFALRTPGNFRNVASRQHALAAGAFHSY